MAAGDVAVSSTLGVSAPLYRRPGDVVPVEEPESPPLSVEGGGDPGVLVPRVAAVDGDTGGSGERVK
jgi:hypothetical protein